MKILMSIVMCLMLLFVGVSVADNGTSVGNRSYTLLSSSSVATGATVTSSATVFDNPMNAIACDLVLSNATATGLFNLEGSVGSQVSGSYAFQAGNLVSSGTVTANTVNTYFVTGKPVRVIRARYQNGVGVGAAYTATVNCHGVQ